MSSRYLVQTAWLSLATEAHYRENPPLHKAKNEKRPQQAIVRTLFTQSVQNRYDYVLISTNRTYRSYLDYW
jgi:cellulose biosynthesis protein BcsQ